MLALRLAAPLALSLACGAASAADDFARLAPPDAALVVNLSDYARAKDLLMAAPVGRLTTEPGIADLLEDVRKEQMAQFETLAAELGIDVEQWPEPEGMVGFALLTRPVPDAEPWEPAFTQTFVGAIEFGGGIVEIQRILDAVVDRGLDQGLIHVETDDIGGVEVLTITTVPQDDEIADEMDPAFEPSVDAPTGLRGLLMGIDSATVAISGSTLYIGGEKELVMDTLDRDRGADLPALADQDLFTAALAQHPRGTTDYLVAFPGRLGLVEGFAMGLGFFLPPGMDVAEILGSLGITGMKVLSLGLDLESPDAQAEFSLGVLDPEKSGLVSLLDVTGEPWNPPAFVTPDAAAASRLLVDFARLPEVLREFWATFPPELQAEGGMVFEQAMAFIEPIAPLLGPEVHIIQTITRPISLGSGGQVYVIPTSDELPLNNLLVLASTSGAFTARNFGATKIYDENSGVVSAAVAYGHVFIGDGRSVEGALRLAGGNGGQTLGDDQSFQAALRSHPGTGNAVQFTRTVDVMEVMLWAAQNSRTIMLQQLRDAGWTQEEIAEFGQDEDVTPEWIKNLSIDSLRRGFGDISMEVVPSDDGFRGRILLHNPR